MQNQNLTPQLAGLGRIQSGDDETKTLLKEISEKLGILIDLQKARCPPKETTDASQLSGNTEEIDTSWIDPDNWYDNSQFCRIFNVAAPTAQKWRAKRMISYIKIGNRVNYPGKEIIRFIYVYVSPRKYTVTPVGVND